MRYFLTNDKQSLNNKHSLVSDSKSSGFTIIELMLATAVFSVTLLIALNGFLQIGQLFYKGVSNTQTQSVTRQIVNEMTRNLQISPDVSLQQSEGNYFYYCLANNRYTYARVDGQAVKLDLSAPQNYDAGSTSVNFGLLKDTLSGSNACAPPCVAGSCPAGGRAFDNNTTELLGNKMRLGQLEITNNPTAPDLYNITVTVIYGDDESIEGLDNPESAACSGSLSNQQFCSVSTLATSVYKGLQP